MDELDREDPVVAVESLEESSQESSESLSGSGVFARSTSRGGPVSAAAEPIKLTGQDWEEVLSAPSVWIRTGDETVEGSRWAKAQPVLEHRHDDPFFFAAAWCAPARFGEAIRCYFRGNHSPTLCKWASRNASWHH